MAEIDPDSLTQAAMTAVRATWTQLLEKYRGERVIGYALCTDDCLMTLYHVGCTAEFCARHPIADAHVAPVEWEQSGDDRQFDAAYTLLVDRYETASAEDRRALEGKETGTYLDFVGGAAFTRHVDQSFGCLVSALRQLRKDELFPENVFLCVTSTDPSEHLYALATAAVRELNAPALSADWVRDDRMSPGTN